MLVNREEMGCTVSVYKNKKEVLEQKKKGKQPLGHKNYTKDKRMEEIENLYLFFALFVNIFALIMKVYASNVCVCVSVRVFVSCHNVMVLFVFTGQYY